MTTSRVARDRPRHDLGTEACFAYALPVLLLLLVALLTTSSARGQTQGDLEDHARHNPSQSTADHRRFSELDGPFDINEISKVCLDCHNGASLQIHETTHWTWEVTNGRSDRKLGKKMLPTTS